MLMGGGDMQMASGDILLAEPSIEEIPAEPSIEQQIFDLQQSITFLEEIWMTDDLIQQEISSDDWQAFMDALYEYLSRLQTEVEQ